MLSVSAVNLKAEVAAHFVARTCNKSERVSIDSLLRCSDSNLELVLGLNAVSATNVMTPAPLHGQYRRVWAEPKVSSLKAIGG